MKNVFFVAILFALAVTISAQSSVPSISWARGDTIQTLTTRYPNYKFTPDGSLGSIKSYKVIEGREPTTTETTFIFGIDGRLATVIYRKTGAALDVYEPLFEKYKSIYGNPKENNKFGINQYQTQLNGFLCFTGDCKFENSSGSVNLMIVVSDSKNLPYVLLTETYKY